MNPWFLYVSRYDSTISKKIIGGSATAFLSGADGGPNGGGGPGGGGGDGGRTDKETIERHNRGLEIERLRAEGEKQKREITGNCKIYTPEPSGRNEKPEDYGVTVPYVLYGIENTVQAVQHYYNGYGLPITLGNNTIETLILSDKFQYHHKKIVDGKTTLMEGFFKVNMTSKVYHVGRTMVDYKITCSEGICTVTYTLFARDGFWDPDYLSIFQYGNIVKPDGPGPLYEFPGGHPYPYEPIIGTHTFPNPGYKF